MLYSLLVEGYSRELLHSIRNSRLAIKSFLSDPYIIIVIDLQKQVAVVYYMLLIYVCEMNIIAILSVHGGVSLVLLKYISASIYLHNLWYNSNLVSVYSNFSLLNQ